MSTLIEIFLIATWEFIAVIITVALALVWVVGRRFILLLFTVEKVEAKMEVVK